MEDPSSPAQEGIWGSDDIWVTIPVSLNIRLLIEGFKQQAI